jgi:hypothetical protein
MATRTIVTSQPDVECDVCARRLLRGEQPDVFIGAGRRRIVCELCAPRAAHEGWLRERDSQSLALPPARPRRGRSLFERLSVAFGVRDAPAPVAHETGLAGGALDSAPSPLYDARADTAAAAASPPAAAYEDAQAALGAWPVTPGETALPVPAATPSAAAGPRPGQPQPGLHEQAPLYPDAAAGAPGAPPLETAAAASARSPYPREALEVFNASPFPRRVAGVIRSLGAPLVNVRSAEHLASVVRIVVAWELCWYRYEVDLSEPEAVAEVIAQGSELGELPREDRVPNANATDGGSLVLAHI